MKICIDMGHTPTSPGASGYIDELAEDRKFGPRLITELERRGHSIVRTTPPDWMWYPNEINHRVAVANASNADLFVSLHFNAGGGTGTEVLHYPGDARGKSIAERISANLASALGLRNRGPKARNNVGVIVNTKMTAVLVETCFVDNWNDKQAYDRTSWDSIVNAVADGIEGSAHSGGSSSGSSSAPSRPSGNGSSLGKVNVRYALRLKNGGWLEEVTNFGPGENGFAGYPFREHDLLYMSASSGTLKYQVHTMEDGWLPYVTKGDPNDTVNGCAGIPGHTIDGVRAYYITPDGYEYQQAWYRSQTVAREGWLGVVCDDGTSISGYVDDYAGMYGEALDRLQIAIGDSNPF